MLHGNGIDVPMLCHPTLEQHSDSHFPGVLPQAGKLRQGIGLAGIHVKDPAVGAGARPGCCQTENGSVSIFGQEGFAVKLILCHMGLNLIGFGIHPCAGDLHQHGHGLGRIVHIQVFVQDLRQRQGVMPTLPQKKSGCQKQQNENDT